MQYIVKLFPEITIKSKPVRRQLVSQLATNLRRVLKRVEPSAQVERSWDKLLVTVDGDSDALRERMAEMLGRIPGIDLYLEVQQFPLGTFEDTYRHVLAAYGPLLPGKTFAVRCKRAGRHDFRSVDVERYIGGELNQHTDALGVDLGNPDIVVRLEIRDQVLYVVRSRHKGLGGFPLAGLDPVLSLISGGFDSTVSSYLTMRRGMCTHFCFFNLGGRDHELRVKEVALYLWMTYGSSQRVRFITVPFEEVVAELLGKIEDSQMGVILKRMMLRAASRIAEGFEIDALVTGESIAQVSSQTLRNLAVIDQVTDKLVLRPLVATDKLDIIRIAAQIGTEDFAASMPEYCGVISVNPTTRARPERIAAEEERFDMAVLERALAAARVEIIDQMAENQAGDAEVEVLSVPLAESTIIDIRHPDEVERQPLNLKQPVLAIPFYQLHSRVGELERERSYMLYCDRGTMSRLHAGHLLQEGYGNIKVFEPAPRSAATARDEGYDHGESERERQT